MMIGLEQVSASVTALLVGLIPLATVAFAHLLIDGERMHRGLVPGFVLALVGTGLLVEAEGGPGTNPALGIGLIVLGVLAAGAGGALTRGLPSGPRPPSSCSPSSSRPPVWSSWQRWSQGAWKASAEWISVRWDSLLS